MMEKQLIIKNNILLKTIFQDKSKSKKKKIRDFNLNLAIYRYLNFSYLANRDRLSNYMCNIDKLVSIEMNLRV